MDSDIIQFILQWAILPLTLLVVWVIQQIFSLKSKTDIMQTEHNERAESRQIARKELMDAIHTHNKNVMVRLTSIEEYLRDGRRNSKA
jgi:hypothetical protein